MFNKNFYPTPETLAHRMFNKVKFGPFKTILEPSAGKLKLNQHCARDSLKTNIYR